MPSQIVILADRSGSMATPEGGGTRMSLLEAALIPVIQEYPHAAVVAFGSFPEEVKGFEPRTLRLPEPAGSTALHLALEHVAKWRPERIVCISDGEPDDRVAALRAARALAPVEISAIYVGCDGNRDALGFMQSLAGAGGRPGLVGVRSLARPEALSTEIRGLLGR
jgi:hypothetical protein